MKEDFADSEIVSPDLFQTIWLSPRETFQHILNYSRTKHVRLLLFLAAVTQSFSRAEFKNVGDDNSLIIIILMVIFVGGFLTYLLLRLYSFLIRWIGNEWLHGKAKSGEITAVLAWSSIPSIFCLALVILKITMLGQDAFSSELSFDPTPFTEIVLTVISIIETILSFWSIYFLVIGISVAQKFSVWNALGNLVLTSTIIALPILLIFLLMIPFVP